MSTLETARAAIVAKLAALAVGVIHDHEPYAADVARLKALYLDPAAACLAGWFVQRTATREVRTAIGRSVEFVDWRIRGYRALSEADASELEFDARIETIRDAFRGDPTLGGAVADSSNGEDEGPEGVQLEESGPVLFAGVLCHAATLRLTTMNVL